MTSTNERVTIKIGFASGRVEEMDIEEYVKHVVPYEMPTYASLEALKAQAICARSYALANKGKHGSFDVCTTQHCQVYGEDTYPSTDQAVEKTKGIVGVFNGKIVPTFFSAYCDGHTTDAPFGRALPYLKSVSCGCPLTTSQQLKAWYAKNGGGHQGGMCQRGAMGMTRNYLDILNHYFNCEWRADYGAGSTQGEPTDEQKLAILWQDYQATH